MTPTSYRKPKKYDYNLIVIGGGSGGLVSSYIAASIKARVALVEQHKMGGDCLNTGCVPSKALIRSAKMLSYASRASEFGLTRMDVEFSFENIMKRVQDIIRQVEPHDSVERYEGLGVKCFSDRAHIVSPHHVMIGKQTYTTKHIIVATGASALVPPIPGLDQVPYLTSDTIWDLKHLPKQLIVLGGGPIGCELAQSFARFGANVTIVEMAGKLLIREDEEVSKLITHTFKQESINVLTGHTAKEVIVKGDKRYLRCESTDGNIIEQPFDDLLLALGRRANVSGFGLEELGIELTPQKTIKTNGYLQTNIRNIYACGDVVGPYQFTHSAAHQAWYSAVNSLFAPFKFKVDYRVLPWCTFTDPEVARVGLSEADAKAQGIPYEVARYGIDDLDRAIADSQTEGFVKVLTKPGKDTILGVTFVGHHAGDLIAEFVLAMKHGLGLNKILQTIHSYPTMAEANKYTAGVWRKAHLPERLLKWLAVYHRFKRGGTS